MLKLKSKFFISLVGCLFILFLTSGGKDGKKNGKEDICVIDARNDKDVVLVFDWSIARFSRNSSCPPGIASQFPLLNSNIQFNDGTQDMYAEGTKFYCIVKVTGKCKDPNQNSIYYKEYILWQQQQQTIKIPSENDFLLEVEYYEECNFCAPSNITGGGRLRALYQFKDTYPSAYSSPQITIKMKYSPSTISIAGC